jgi:hypothetical protein
LRDRVAAALGFRNTSDYESAARARIRDDAVLGMALRGLIGPPPSEDEPQALGHPRGATAGDRGLEREDLPPLQAGGSPNASGSLFTASGQSVAGQNTDSEGSSTVNPGLRSGSMDLHLADGPYRADFLRVTGQWRCP